MTTNTSINDITELEGILSMNTPVKSSVKSRWERKQANENTCPSSTQKNDRFIPNRSSVSMELSSFSLTTDVGKDDSMVDSCSTASLHETKVESTLTNQNPSTDCRILSFKARPPQPREEFKSSVKVLYSQKSKSTGSESSSLNLKHHIPSAPFRVLDAPDFMDDYYLNLLSWSFHKIYFAPFFSYKTYHSSLYSPHFHL